MGDIIIVYNTDGYVLRKRMCDGMFDATLLLKQYNARFRPTKRFDIFLRNESTCAFVNGLKRTPTVTVVDIVRDRANNKTFWICPQLFVILAYWLNPECGASVSKCVSGGMCEPTDTESGYTVLMDMLGVTDADKFKTSFERIAGVMPKARPDNAQNAEIKALQDYVADLVKNKSYGYDDVVREFGVLYDAKFNNQKIKTV